MNRFHALASVATVSLGVVLSGAALAQNAASNFCVAVNGGFGSGGTSYVAPAFTLPAKNNCAACRVSRKRLAPSSPYRTVRVALPAMVECSRSAFSIPTRSFSAKVRPSRIKSSCVRKESRAVQLLAKTSVTSGPASQYSRPARPAY
jgi:hypothetical protein